MGARLAAILAFCAALSVPCAGQGFPFQIVVQQGDSAGTINNNGTVNVAATGVGQSTDLHVTVTYRGNSTAALDSVPSLLGSSDFSLVDFPKDGLMPSPGAALSFTLRYRARTANTATVQFNLGYTENPSPPGTLATRGAIALNFTGTAPLLVIGYLFASDGNVIPLPAGGKLLFPPTVINTTSVATVSITNRGSAGGMVDAIALTGEGFQLLGVPLLPIAVSSAQQLQIAVRYAPKQIGTNTGTLNVSINGTGQSFAIEASSTASQFTYEYLSGDQSTPVAPGGSIQAPDSPIGTPATFALRMRNSGNADGVVNAIALVGDSFALTNPPILPRTLAAGAALVFTATFTPRQAGSNVAQLRIGNDSFQLTGRGIGPRLEYSYRTGDTPFTLVPGGAVLFSPVAVTQESRAVFTIHNTGTSSTTISVVGVVESKNGFRLDNLPKPPLTLDADGTAQFDVVFAPTIMGFSNATLRVDTAQFALSGIGSDPPALPAYRIDGPTSPVQPFQQLPVGLTLEQPYPAALTGVLALNVDSGALPNDPAVQFSTGGRSVPFTIPAKSLQAVFPNGQTQVRLQTGTVAGALTLSPTFATQAGNLDLTPASATRVQLSVPAAAPRIVAARVDSQTATGIVLAVTGYANARTLSQIDLDFTPSPNFKMDTAHLTIRLGPVADGWFQSSTSSGSGGQFTLAIPLNIQVSGGSATTINVIQTIAATLRNTNGVSNTVTIPLSSDSAAP